MAEENIAPAVPVEKKAVKKTTKVPKAMSKPVKKSAPCCDQTMLFVMIAVIAVVAIILAYFLMSGKPSGGDAKPAGSVKMSEISAKMATSMKTLSQVTIDGSADITMSASGEQQTLTMAVDFDAAYDLPGKKGKTISTMTMPGVSQSGAGKSEVYMMGNTMYMGSVDSYGGEMMWIKQAAEEDIVSAKMMNSTIGMLNAFEGTYLGTETVNGEQADKMAVTPNIRTLISTVVESQYGDLEAMGVDATQMEEAISLIENSVKQTDVVIWFSKETSLPLKAEGGITLEMDIGTLTGTPGVGGGIQMQIDFLVNADYTTPVSISLPAEALNATDLADVYSPVCGDGYCDYDEDEDICPEDCQTGACVDMCGDGNCDEVVCLAAGCPCAETPEGCPEDCA